MKRPKIIAAIFVILLIGISAPQLKALKGVSPNVLLITVDSLRPEYLGCYGDPHSASPNIDRLAKEGVLFTQAIAQGSWTLPSMVSIATSAYPSTHKVYAWEVALSPALPSISKILKSRGYQTFFCSAHAEGLSEVFSVHGDFDQWSAFQDPVPASKVTEAALGFLRKNRQKNFFLWIHYMDTHDRVIGNFSGETRALNGSQKRAGIRAYETAIARADKAIGVITDELKALHKERDTLVVISADHGEEICEHAFCFEHGGYLWDSLLRVPLIVVWPGHLPRNRRISSQVRHIDIAPTICDLINVQQPRSFEGESLLPVISRRGASSGTAFSEHREYEGDAQTGRLLYSKFSLRSFPWKLIYTVRPGREDYELFNLENDPRESDNLAGINTKQCQALKEKLAAWMNRPRPAISPVKQEISGKNRESLKSLGYLQ